MVTAASARSRVVTPTEGAILPGRYKLVKAIGQGGMGCVYEAVQLDLQRRVAIKVLQSVYSNDAGMLARFQREALTSATLQHPNIAQTTALVMESGTPPFLVMELVSGEPLRAILNREILSPQRTARIAVQILDALELAHEHGIVHRDIKPGNLMITPIAGGGDLVKLLDFGIAKILDEARFSRLTQTGSVLGSPGFMAPEQARGATIDGRTDLYSLGIVLYRAVAGRLPFDGRAMELVHAILHADPHPLLEIAAHVDARFAAIVDRAIRRDPKERFQSAAEMREVLLPIAREPMTASIPLPAPDSVPPITGTLTERDVPPPREIEPPRDQPPPALMQSADNVTTPIRRKKPSFMPKTPQAVAPRDPNGTSQSFALAGKSTRDPNSISQSVTAVKAPAPTATPSRRRWAPLLALIVVGVVGIGAAIAILSMMTSRDETPLEIRAQRSPVEPFPSASPSAPAATSGDPAPLPSGISPDAIEMPGQQVPSEEVVNPWAGPAPSAVPRPPVSAPPADTTMGLTRSRGTTMTTSVEVLNPWGD